MGKLGWFMLKTETATFPPREGEPPGDWNKEKLRIYRRMGKEDV